MPSVIEVPLTRGKIAVIDEADAPLIFAWKWHASHCGRESASWYARRTINQSGRFYAVWMHHVILGVGRNVLVDHRNGNGLDNTRGNLRVANHFQNSANRQNNVRGSFKGVHFNVARGRWTAHIRVNYRKLHLGMFDDRESAARAYDDAARRYFGDFAKTNF